jgi:glycosyltransferase involved in cell wall biosynthesis
MMHKDIPVRILHVYRTYFPDPPGGIQEVIRQLCLAVQPHGVESRIFTLSPSPEPRLVTLPEGLVVRGHSIAAPASCDIGGLAAFQSFRQAAAWADIVQLHYPWPFGDLLRMLIPTGKPCILTYHSDIVRQRWLGQVYAPLMHHTLRKVSVVVAATPDYAKSSLILTLPAVAQKLHIIPYGIQDRRSLYAPIQAATLRQRFGLGDKPYFLSLGVFRYYKGLHSLVTAAKDVKATIVLAGSGPENERLRAQAQAIGADNIIFAGQVSDDEKFALLEGCQAFVLPSHLRSEAFGMVLVEAAMMGRPMICCAIGSGMTYINLHNQTGLAVAPEAPQELAAAMNRMLGEPDLRQRMSLAARQRYETVFSSTQVGAAYSQLYKKLLD